MERRTEMRMPADDNSMRQRNERNTLAITPVTRTKVIHK